MNTVDPEILISAEKAKNILREREAANYQLVLAMTKTFNAAIKTAAENGKDYCQVAVKSHLHKEAIKFLKANGFSVKEPDEGTNLTIRFINGSEKEC